ncbi:MAG: hypothetical protein ABEL51_12940 [Salinibacter sp.]
MTSVPSSHAAGRAAYTRGTPSSQPSPSSTSSPDSPEKTTSGASAQKDTALQKTGESTLTTEEQQMIEENFPEDPELSMQLYGRSRGTETVRTNSVGGNLDVTG